jgi:hypothetical protein
VFAINTDGRGFTNLYSFTGGNDGANPMASLISSGSSLYGTSSSYSSTKLGAVFSVPLQPQLIQPQLTITPAGANVLLTWPTSATGFSLQSSTSLGSTAVWTTNLPAPVIGNGQNTVTSPISGTLQFFRLSQ